NSKDNPKRVLYHQWNGKGGKAGQASNAETFRTGQYREKYDQHIDAWSKAADQAARDTALRSAQVERDRNLDIFLTAVDVYYERNKNFLINGRAGAATV